jgi:dsRNA-specific ribonuclease
MLHRKTMTDVVAVNGIAKGEGTGTSKQLAKEEAARKAYYAMGWT